MTTIADDNKRRKVDVGVIDLLEIRCWRVIFVKMNKLIQFSVHSFNGFCN